VTTHPLPSVFTIAIDGKPTITFEASNLREAFELGQQDWLRADLTTLNSNGSPLCGPQSSLRARIATDRETAAYREGFAAAVSSDDILLVYLVDLDDGG
jgi:hypothetical protein